MTRFFSGIMLFLASFGAYALEDQAPVQLPPPDPLPMIAFAVIFFGGIGATIWYMWRNEKNRKQGENEQQ